MSKIQVDTIVNKTDDGAPDFPNGATVTGVVTATSFNGSGASLTGIITSGGGTVSGIITATSFIGDGSGLTGVSSWESYDSWLFGGG